MEPGRASACAPKTQRAAVAVTRLNDLGLWAVNHLLARAKLLGACEPNHYLLPADLSKHTKKSDVARQNRIRSNPASNLLGVRMAQVGHVSAEMTRHYTHLGSN